MAILEKLKEVKLSDLKELEDKLQETQSSKNSLQMQYTQESSKKFNFFQRRVTKTVEYKAHLESLKKLDEEIRKSLELEQKTYEQINNFRQVRQPVIERATTLKDLGLTFTQAKAFLEQRGINVKLQSCEEGLEIAEEYFSSNAEFMKRAIKENPNFIMFDKTNAREVYFEFIDRTLEQMDINDLRTKSLYEKYFGFKK